MLTLIAGLFAAGLCSLLAALGDLLTRGAPDPADTHYTQTLATVGQTAVGLALILYTRAGYHPVPLVHDLIYAAMAAAFAGLLTRLPHRDQPEPA